MKQLTTFEDDRVFYYGTIIVIKGGHTDSFDVTTDKRYAMVASNLLDGYSWFLMVDLHRSIGSGILQDLKPNVPGHNGVNKEGIKDWVRDHFKYFYREEWVKETVTEDYLDSVIYIEDLRDYFRMCNRNLNIPKENNPSCT